MYTKFWVITAESADSDITYADMILPHCWENSEFTVTLAECYNFMHSAYGRGDLNDEGKPMIICVYGPFKGHSEIAIKRWGPNNGSWEESQPGEGEDLTGKET